MIAFVTYVWQVETQAFFDSVVPNAGYYAVRIVFAIAFIYAIAVAIHWLYTRGKHQGSETPLGKEQPQRGEVQRENQFTFVYPANLDHRFDHVIAHVFWPPRHILNHTTIKGRDDFPRVKCVVNYKTKKAYSFGAYVWSLFLPLRQIELHSEMKWFPFYLKVWCWRKGFELIPLPATEADLLEGSTLQVIPWVMKTSERRLSPDAASKLDPKLGHVFAMFFYPPEVSWERGERNPKENMPRFKAILNTKTRPIKAFWTGVYASSLIENDKIEYITATGNSESDVKQYFAERKIELVDKPASKADLMEGT